MTRTVDLSQSSDQELVTTVLKGEYRAFDVLVTRYRDRLYRFILKHIDDPTKAEDLTQETFIGAYQNLHQFAEQSQLFTWLVGIALNKIRNYLNRAPEKKYPMVSEAMLSPKATLGYPLWKN